MKQYLVEAMLTKNILFIVNPAGKGGQRLHVWNKFKALWPATIEESNVVFTQRQGHATQIAKKYIDKDFVVAVGGDGTISEVAGGIYENGTDIQMEIIPAGSGNDIAHSLGITNVEDAIESLANPIYRTCDMIQVDYQKEHFSHSRYALAYAGIGFSAIQWAKPWMKKYFGAKAAYYLAILKEIIVFEPPNLKIKGANFSDQGKMVAVALANIEQIGGKTMRVAPGATVDDGKMYINIIPFNSRFDMLFRLLPKATKGKHVNEQDVGYFTADQLSVDSAEEVSIAIDGDIVGNTPVSMRFLPGAIRIASID